MYNVARTIIDQDGWP
jgi:pSer/pThr/pTyr-binding forkhead associated (FHA) protein